ncbi:glycerate kinase [uncultured Holdemanella sp.]|uniref:glycerate kinase family protein n=1 Tax=uncultured Holdemanella sp. TaxID=1763549 RepID=UPI0025F4B529|nr:glycerate kinase [uncultured Holdemanella sp.]
MKIIIACDSFKGCMSSKEVEECIKKGILKANKEHEILTFPMADGGEGTAMVFRDIIQGKTIDVLTVDAYGKNVFTTYCISKDGNLAVMDVASCIGLNMTPKEKRNPMIASSRGVGIMMKDAISRGCKKMIIGLGGSATNDGGMGILSEFGVRFYNSKRELLVPSVYALQQIAFIDKRYARLPKDIEIICACDVKNHLLGKNGATYVFGKQKGIYLNQMAEVEKGMAHYSTKLKQTFHVDVNEFEGSGAAGGIGSVLLGVMKAKRFSGIDLVVEYSGLKEHLQDADLVITGEGQTDAQTLYGKLPLGIARLAQSYDVPCVCLSGALGLGYEAMYDEGMIGIFSSADRAMTFQMALQTGNEKLEALAFSLTKFMDGIRK